MTTNDFDIKTHYEMMGDEHPFWRALCDERDCKWSEDFDSSDLAADALEMHYCITRCDGCKCRWEDHSTKAELAEDGESGPTCGDCGSCDVDRPYPQRFVDVLIIGHARSGVELAFLEKDVVSAIRYLMDACEKFGIADEDEFHDAIVFLTQKVGR